MNLKELRQKYPDYADMSDDEFTSSFHKKFYSDIPYEQFATKIGYSKQEKAYSPSDMTSAYDKYSSTIEQENSRPQIPGTPPQKKLTKQEWDKRNNDDLLGRVLGPLDAAASFAMKLPAQLAAGPAALYGAVRGVPKGETVESMAAKVMQGPSWTDPKTETGADLLQGFGDLLQPFGMSPYTNMGAMASRGSFIKPRVKTPAPVIPKIDFEADLKAAKVAPIEVPKPTTPEVMPVTPEGQAMRPEDAMWRDRAQQMQIEALKPVDDAQVEMLQQGIGEQADAIRAKRQTEMELAVKKQQQLDFNAAERARQQNAPTGYNAWVEQQRATAEQRQPGNNTPIDFEQPYPVKAADYPDVLQDAPYQYEGGVDFDTAGPKALPIEVADTLRAGETTPDPFNRYSPNQAARRILEEGDKPEIIKGGQRNPFLGPGKSQAGGVSPEVFLSGFRGINRFLSALTDQPWVKQAFPASHWEKNPDGTPMVLLHGTTRAFNDQPRGVSWEGLHAGYGGAATLKAAERSKGNRVGYRIGNLEFSGPDAGSGSAMYPVAIKKGNYPRLTGDYGSWEPTKLAESRQFKLDFAKATGHGFYDIDAFMSNYLDNIKNKELSPQEENLIFSNMLKNEFGINGFYYPNTYETPQRKLMGNSGTMQTPQRARNLATALKNEDSFVTYDDNNMKSLYDSSVQVPPSYRNKQLGGIAPELLTFGLSNWITGKKTVGGAMSGKLPITGKGTPVPDSVQNPITPATIKAKQQLASAEKYARLGESQYGDVKTIEELRSILDTRGVKDINNNPVRDYTISGVEGMVRNFPNNPIFKFVRSKLTDARNNAAMFETEYVTGTNGINKLYRAMDKNEWANVSEALQAAGRTRRVLTPEQMAKWGMNDKQQAFVLRLREALDAMHATASEALTANGMKGLDKREGYVPSIFSGAYTSLVGHTVTEGGKQKFIIRGIAQGDTKAQHAASLEYYKKRGDKFSTVVELPTRMLSGGVQKSSRVFDGFNDLVNAIAENDKDFAEVKALADTYAAERIRGLKQFNVHEKRKAGVMGSLGDRPWLSREQNAQQFLEGLVNYLDEGAKYYNYQNPLHQVTKIMNDPAIATDRPNTMKYLDRYVAHVTGQSVGAHGKFLNQVWNATLKTLGSSPAQVGTNIHRLHGAASAYMMGLWNPAFAITQMVQPAASGIPEAIGVNKITETGFAQAMSRNMIYSPIIDAALSSDNAKVLDGLPPHLVAAFKHAQDIGMTAFSESELTREVLQSKTENRINSVLHAPSQITERATRPMVFLTYVDMFHQAGFDASTSYRAAQYATDFAMTNYHPDERPMMYATFGHTGNFMGALTTYKHNLGTGMWTRSKDVATGKAFAPTAAAVSLGAALYGISGIAGYQEMDELTQLLTGKTIKETVFPVGNKLGDKPMLDGAWHGFASTASGYDFQSRLSMASALPDGPLDALSPQLSVFVDIGTKAYELFKNQDEQAALALGLAATPVGMKGIVEAKQFTDPEGFLLDASGKRKFDAPRTPQEQTVRKIIGIRPLRERLETDDLFADSKQNKKTQEKLNNHAKRFKDAILRNDEAGIDFHYQQYVDKGGDPAVLFNDKAIAKWLEDSMKSQRERQQGEPKANMGSMRKFEEYAD